MNKSSVSALCFSVLSAYSTLNDRMNAAVAAEAPSGSAPQLEEVIVTAQKRSERVNDVPLSITTATGENLLKAGVKSPSDLEKLVPGFTYQSSEYGMPVFTIRGIGYLDNSLAIPPAVSVYVDQVPYSYLAMTPGTSLDVERVEVLKGPQGTLFGQNSTGGAINFIANKPTPDLHYGGDLSYGRFNDLDVQGFVSGPLFKDVTARLALRTEQR